MAKYKILIKGTNNAYTFATATEEVMEKVIEDDQIVEKPTGKFVLVDFETEELDELKQKYIELLDTYKKDQINAISDISETVTINVEFEDTNIENDENDNVDEV